MHNLILILNIYKSNYRYRQFIQNERSPKPCHGNILKETVELLINDENEFDKTVNNNSIKKSFKLKS